MRSSRSGGDDIERRVGGCDEGVGTGAGEARLEARGAHEARHRREPARVERLRRWSSPTPHAPDGDPAGGVAGWSAGGAPEAGAAGEPRRTGERAAPRTGRRASTVGTESLPERLGPARRGRGAAALTHDDTRTAAASRDAAAVRACPRVTVDGGTHRPPSRGRGAGLTPGRCGDPRRLP